MASDDKPVDLKETFAKAMGKGQPASLRGRVQIADPATADAFRSKIAGGAATAVDTAADAVIHPIHMARSADDLAQEHIGSRPLGTTARPALTPVPGKPGMFTEPSAAYIPAQSSAEKAAASSPKAPEVDPAAAAQEMAMQEMAKQQAAQQAASAAQSASANKALHNAGKSYVQALTAENQAALKLNEQQAASADAMAAEHRARQAFFENQQQKEAAAAEMQRHRQQEAMQQYQERSEMAWKQAQGVSKSKFWEDKGALGSVATILGGIASAFGSPKQAQSYIARLDQQINEHVQMQVAKANATEKYADNAMNIYKMTRDQGADDSQARAIAREVGYKQVMAHLDETASRSGSAEIRAQVDAIKANLQKNLAAMQMQAAQKAAALAASSSAAPKDITNKDLSYIPRLQKDQGIEGDVGAIDRLEAMINDQMKKDPRSPVAGTGAKAAILERVLPYGLGKKLPLVGMSNEEISTRSKFDTTTQRVLKDISGQAVPEAQQKAWENRLLNATTAIEQQSVVSEMADILRTKRADVAGAIPERDAEEYDRRKRLAAARGKLDKK